MKAWSGAFTSHMAGVSRTLATCFRIVRTDLTVFAFTDHDREITVDLIDYTPIGAFTGTAAESQSGLAIDNLEVDAIIEATGLTDQAILAGLFDLATYEIFIVNWANPAGGTNIVSAGTLGKISHDAYTAQVELRSLSQYLRQPIGRTRNKRCDADLGDARCQVNLATYTVTGTVASVVDRAQFSVGAGETPAAPGGLLTFTSGDNDTFKREVQSISGNEITLILPVPFDITIGTTVSSYRGCDKLRSTCKTVFNNVVNHRGWADLVGDDHYFDFP